MLITMALCRAQTSVKAVAVVVSNLNCVDCSLLLCEIRLCNSNYMQYITIQP